MRSERTALNGKKPELGWAGKVFLLGVGLLIAFAGAEIGLRAYDYISKQAQGETWAVYDEDLGYRNRPNYGDHNADGLRRPPIGPKQDRFRILMLGDSVAYYGDSAADTFVGRLGAVLDHDPARAPSEVINAGTRGYTNYQELVYLKKYGVKFQSDLVGVAFVLNDLHKFLHQFEVKDGQIVGQSYHFSPEAIQSVDSWVYRLARKSVFLVWLRENVSLLGRWADLRAAQGYTFDYRPDFNTAWKEEAWEPIAAQLGEMVALGKEAGFRVFLVAFPFGEQLRADYLARDRAHVTRPQQRLKLICERLDIPYLDLFPEIEAEKHLVSDGIHLTREGRELAARRIAAFLAEQELIPRSRLGGSSGAAGGDR